MTATVFVFLSMLAITFVGGIATAIHDWILGRDA
jgi:hypothetical protein